MTTDGKYGKAVQTLLTEVDALRQSLWMTMTLLEVAIQVKLKKLRVYCAEHEIEEKSGDGVLEFTVPTAEHLEFSDVASPLRVLNTAYRLTPHSILVALVSQYDALLGEILRTTYHLRPELLHASEKTFACRELWEFDSIDEARAYAVENEIESFLRKSHVKQFKLLENQLGISLRTDLTIWPEFVELTERRNLIVHTNAVVSAQYITVCKREGVVLGDDIVLGVELTEKPDYFFRACQCIKEMGVKLSQVVWRKLFPEEVGEAETALINTTYTFVEDEEYELALRLLTFALEGMPRPPDEESLLIYTVNKAQVHKWLKDSEPMEETLAGINWTAKDLPFQLAHAVLTDDFHTAASLMRQIGPDNKRVDETGYRRWPLFKEFRNTDEFQDAFFDVFGKHAGEEEEAEAVVETFEEIEEFAGEEIEDLSEGA